MKRKSSPRTWTWNPFDLLRVLKPSRGKPIHKTVSPMLEWLESRVTPANVDVLSGHYDSFLSGQNLQETTLTPANVNATDFGMLFNAPIDGQAYAQPLYKTGVMINGTPHNVAFIATEHDSVYAFDADTGAQLWHDSFIDPANGITTIPYAEISTPDIFPEIGITSTGVIDPSTSTLYEVVRTKEIRSDGGVHYVEKLHALDLATGAEKLGGPYTIGDTHVASAGATPVFANETTAIMVPGTGGESSGGANPMVPFSAEKENSRTSLALEGNIVYVAFTSDADFRPYHGWIIGFDKTTLQPVKVFNTSPNADGVAIWESNGGLSFDSQGYMYFATANGFQTGSAPAFDPAQGNYSESVIKLDTTPNWSPSNPGNMMTVVDYFTPNNWQSLDGQDADLGSGGVMLLPDSVGSAAHQHLMVETGKQGVIYLIDRDNMGKNVPAGQTDNVVQEVTAGQAGVWGNAAFYQLNATTGIIYYHGSGDYLKGYLISNGHIDDTPADILKSTFFSNFPGTQPSVSANGTANPLNPTNGIVWELQVDNAVGRIQGVSDNTSAGPVTLRAFSTTNLSTELYDSSQMGQRDFATGSVKFTFPVVTNGHVLVAGADHFAVFGLFPQETNAPAAPSNLTAQLHTTSTGPQIQLTWTNPAPNPGSDPTGIKIFRSTDGVNFTQINTVNRNLTTFTDTGPFQFGQTIYYRVVATNQVGDSPASNTVNVVVPIPPPVLTVTGAGASSVSLSWTGLANDHFDIERSTDGINFTRIASIPASQTSYTDTGLTPGLYTYRIHAFNVNPNADALSNVEGVWVGSMIDHSTPSTGGFVNATDLTTNGSAFVGGNLVELTSATNQAGSVFSNTRFTVANFTTTFDVRLHEGTQPNYADGFAFVFQTNSPTALGSAAAGIGYQGIGHSVAVVFNTFQHTGEPSSSSVGLAINGAVDSNPVDTTPSGLLLNSQDPKDIQLSYNGATLTVRIQDIDQPQLVFTTSFTVNIAQDLGSDTAYVGFTGGSGSNNYYELEDVLSWKYTSQAPLPGAPTNLRVASSTSSELDLAWNANSFNETGFQVWRSTDGTNFTLIATTTVPSYRDAGLANGTYYYQVRAVNGAGNSPYSNTLQTSVPAPILTQHQDIGTAGDPSVAGNATFSNGVYTLTASGSDIWGNADHMQYLYAPLTGDGQIIARVLSLTPGVNDDAKAGVMFRDSLDAGASDAFMMQFPNPGSRPGWPTYQWRAADGGTTADHEFQTAESMPLWLRLVRSGTTFIGYWAVDVNGAPGAWQQLGSETVTMGATAYVGLAVTSHQNGQTVTATFDHVQILPAVDLTSHLDVSASAPLVNPGTPVNITVKALDPFNNVVSSYRGTIHFTSSDQTLGLPADYTFTAADNGVHTFTITPQTLGSLTITATDTASNNTISGATTVTVTNNPLVSSFLVTGFPSPIHAGLAGSFTVTALDSMGHTVTGYRGTVHFTSSDPKAQLPADYTFTAADNGVHTFTATLNTAGTQSITVTDAAAHVSGSQSNIMVAAPLTITSITRGASTINEGGQFTLNGQFNDPLTGQGHTVVISWGDGSPNTTLSLAAGVLTFSGSHQYVEEGNYTIQVTVRAPDGSSDTVTLPVNAAAIAPPAGLVSWWTGDGNGPTAPDLAGNNPGTLNGGVTYTPGKVGNAFTFDGNSNRGSYVNVPDAPSLDSTTGTWDFWFKTTQTGVYIGLVGKNDGPGGSNNGITMEIGPDGHSRIEIKGPGPTLLLNGTTVVNDGQWHHMALTFQSGGTSIMYVDGQQQASGTAPTFSFGANDPLRFGTMTDPFWTPLNGQLDEVQIFNRVLSASEIQSIYNAGSAGQIKGAHVSDLAVAPTGGFTVTAAVGIPSSMQTVAVFTDPAGPEALADYSATINWGDKTATSAGVISFNAATGMFTVQGSHPYAQVGNYVITVTIHHDTAPDATATSAAQVFTPILHLAGLPSSTVAGTPVSFTVTVQDPFAGTTITGYRGTVHFSSSDPQAGLPADYTFTAADNGSHTFTVTPKTAGNETFTVTDTSNALLTATASTTVTPAAASTYLLTGFPKTVGSGVFDAVIVTADDPYGNIATGYTGTVHLTSSDPAAVLPANYTFTTADHGQHAFAISLATLGTQSITATDTATPTITGSESGIIVTPASFQITGLPSAVNAGDVNTITVSALNANGNVLPNFTGTVHFTSSDPQALLPADYTFTAADQGSHSFIVSLLTTGTQSLNVSLTGVPGANVQGAASTFVSAQAAETLTVTGLPSTVTAGTPVTFTVTAKDPFGNVDPNYTGTITFSSTDPQAGLPADYTFTAADQGSHTFSAILGTAGPQSITATDVDNGFGGSAGTVVTPGVATQAVVTYPSEVTAGTANAFTVTLLDAYGNTATGYRGTIHFSSSDPQAGLPADYTFTGTDQGTHTFNVTLKTAGMQSITATQVILPPPPALLKTAGTQSITATDTATSRITATVSGIQVDPAAVSKLVVSGYPSPAVAGTTGAVMVAAEDAYGNINPNYAGTVHLSSDDPQAVFDPDYTFTSDDAGVHVFSATLFTAGTNRSITATDVATASIVGSQTGITVTPAAASQISVTFTSPTATAGQPASATIVIQDAYGNTVTGYTGTVTFSSSDPQAVLPANYTFTAADQGVHAFNVTLETAGSQSLTVQDTSNGSITGTGTVVVNPAAVAGFSVSGPSSVSSGTVNQYTVTAIDAFGNTVTNYTGTVHLSSDDTDAALPGDYTFTAADGGTHTFNVVFGSPGTYYLQATDVAKGYKGSQTGIVVQ